MKPLKFYQLLGYEKNDDNNSKIYFQYQSSPELINYKNLDENQGVQQISPAMLERLIAKQRKNDGFQLTNDTIYYRNNISVDEISKLSNKRQKEIDTISEKDILSLDNLTVTFQKEFGFGVIAKTTKLEAK